MENIDFSSGASYFRSPGAATESVIAALLKGRTGYGPAEGTPELRKAIAERYSSATLQVTPEQIVITPGSKQALFNLFTTLLQQGDEVVIPTPAWFGFHGLMKYSQGKLVTLPTSLVTGYTINPKVLQEVINTRTRILLLTNPGNPTGRLYSKDELEAILEVTAKFLDLYIISDEIYDLDTYDKSFTSILSCQGAKAERTCVVNGFSKTFAMSGWRIGYMVVPMNIAARCVEFQGSTLSGVSLFIQDAALSVLQQENSSLAPMVEVLQEHRSIMQKGLEAIPDVTFYLPDGAYYFFPDFNAYLGTTTPSGKEVNTATDLCDFLQSVYNLQLAPGDNFGAPGHARMSFAVERAHLEEGLKRLKQALTSLIRT